MAYLLADPAALLKIVKQQKRGIPAGIASVCTAHPVVLEACLRQAAKDDEVLLVEATCNQVNQFGGYTGQTPAAFVENLTRLARQVNFPMQQLLLGGDHLGPYAWRKETSASAMAKSAQLIADYVSAGFRKIHLDTSMPCSDDPVGGLALSTSASRTVALCALAEQAAQACPQHPKPVYVIGSEVPSPGGATELNETIKVTTVQDAAETLEIYTKEFARAGLQEAWERVAALVVQPGVEFGDDTITGYERARSAALQRFIRQVPGVVFEAHSTDYQRPEALRQMVEDQFAILKVGPALTFAYREAVLALEGIENAWLGQRDDVTLSNLKDTLLVAMRQEPRYWSDYYHGAPHAVECQLVYSYSDRIRYYWHVPEVQSALQRLLTNLRRFPPPLTLVSQFLPVQYAHIREGMLGQDPQGWLWDGIQAVWQIYAAACRQNPERVQNA